MNAWKLLLIASLLANAVLGWIAWQLGTHRIDITVEAAESSVVSPVAPKISAGLADVQNPILETLASPVRRGAASQGQFVVVSESEKSPFVPTPSAYTYENLDAIRGFGPFPLQLIYGDDSTQRVKVLRPPEKKRHWDYQLPPPPSLRLRSPARGLDPYMPDDVHTDRGLYISPKDAGI